MHTLVLVTLLPWSLAEQNNPTEVFYLSLLLTLITELVRMHRMRQTVSQLKEQQRRLKSNNSFAKYQVSYTNSSLIQERFILGITLFRRWNHVTMLFYQRKLTCYKWFIGKCTWRYCFDNLSYSSSLLSFEYFMLFHVIPWQTTI